MMKDPAAPEAALPPTPSLRLDGRRALVTGASRGLGVAIATALARAGAHVDLVARSRPETETIARAMRAESLSADAVPLDVTDLAAVEKTLATLPLHDILVNNAGTNRPKPMTKATPEDYEAIVGLNLRALFFVSQFVVKRLIAASRGGVILNVSSQMGHVGAPNRTLYCASKHAVEGLTKAMAVELGSSGIRVNTIAPTFIETEMTRSSLSDPAFAGAVLAKIKLGRLGRSDDLMGAVVYLASDAASLVTGTSLRIDGGWTAD
jgi:NAD(P)-dependent dehydrogenase (short-subunit alcohol dehydrogenase family)